MSARFQQRFLHMYRRMPKNEEVILNPNPTNFMCIMVCYMHPSLNYFYLHAEF